MGIHLRLMEAINKIRDDSLRSKMLDLLGDLSIKVGDKRFTGLPLNEAPASRLHHHSYPGGLIDHILSMLNIAFALCDSVENIYGGKVNRDLVICGIILHDIFKPLTYEQREDGRYVFSPLGERIDHLTLIVSELLKRDFPIDLIHVVVTSHGSGSPISPKTIEALICHLADEVDSKLNGEILNAAKYLVKEVTKEEWEKMDAKTAMKILALKAEGGWEGFREGIKLIKKNIEAETSSTP
ncbi:MAG: HD domain-containing protein [Candidatus Bathyarchaeia archaeon]|nr:HD domain-containing protein [Candidatus Bathyarchaeota archaeon]